LFYVSEEILKEKLLKKNYTTQNFGFEKVSEDVLKDAFFKAKEDAKLKKFKL